MLRVIALIAIIFFNNISVAQDERKSITVFASSSLTNATSEIIKNYTLKTGVVVTIVYDSPQELLYLVESGDAADVILLEDPIILRDMKRQGLLDIDYIKPVTKNKIALVASKEHKIARFSGFRDINDNFDKIIQAIANSSLITSPNTKTTYIGREVKSVLDDMGLWSKVQPILVKSFNVRDALYLISKTKGAGFVYYTDGILDDSVVILTLIDPKLHDDMVYYAAVVAGESMNEARDFIDYVVSDAASDIFAKFGFDKYIVE